MKHLFLIVLFFSSLSSVDAQWQRGRLQATGLTCSMCSNAIHKSLSKLSFVDQVDADIAKSMFIITFKTANDIDPDKLRQAVEDAGFAVGNLELEASVQEQPVLTANQHLVWNGFQFHLKQARPELPGAGTWIFRFQDKGFVPAARYKKLAKGTTDPCFTTGKRSAICADHPSQSERIYHIELMAAK